METEGETEMAADVSSSKLQANAVVESSSAEDDDHEAEELPSIQFVKSLHFKRLIQVSVIVSAISVAMNTRKTFVNRHELWYLTLILDILVLTLLTIESFMDMKILGLYKGNLAFFKNRVNLFNLAMLIFIAMSVMLQIIEGPSFSVVIPELVKILARAPRALILLRVMKYFMNYSLLNQVSRRSGKQIRNVTIFLLYFMILASLIGVQLFGEKSYYCVKNDTNLENIKFKDLTLPAEIRCSSPQNNYGAKCPPSFECKHLELSHFNQSTQYFETIWSSFLTVYESSTQEGWVFVMYAEMNSLNKYVSAIYFVSLIFFVAWLVKSVFIAVITETFADLRSQLYLKNWRTNRRVTGLSSEIIQDDGTGWHLVAIKEEWTKTKAFNKSRQFLTSKYFRFMIWTLLAVEALVQAFVSVPERHIFQLVFTIIFDLESLFKIWCVGLKSYWKIPVYRFELFLAAGSSICIAPVWYDSEILVAFQVLRVTRLIIAVPSLHAFLYKAFGTGTKLIAVVIFTLFFLVFASILSLQLFSETEFPEGDEGPFDDFLQSSTSMFQIITQEGWVEVLNKVKYASKREITWLISIYFTIYNLFASLILGSVFIAVILDNLEIKEETKILKQRKLDEEVLNIQETLPRRLRVFEKFKEKPRLVETRKVSGDFLVPKVRQSFMRKFLDDSRAHLLQLAANPSVYEDALLTQCKDLPFKLLSSPVPDDIHTLRLKKRSSLTQLIQDSTRRRNLGEHGKYTRHSAKSYVLGYTARQINRNAAKLTQGARKTSERADLNAVTRMRTQRESVQATLPHSASTRGNEDWNIRELRARREQAQRVKAAHEESLRENHPYFDFPLFLVSRDSRARLWLQRIVHARYEGVSGIYGDVQSKRPMFNDAWIKRMLSTQTYLEWVIILITFCSCIAMMLENAENRTFNVPGLAFFEYLFVVATSVELVIRILADGFLFTPNAVIRDCGDIIDVSIYLIGFAYVCWAPDFIPPRSTARALLVLRALRPLRIINLIPKMRQVIQELFGGFKEILKVAALQLSLMFIFASYGVQMFSNKFGKCNDSDYLTKEGCRGVFNIILKGPHELRGLAGDKNKMLVNRVWNNPKNFDFDKIQNALLALFEALSLEGWLDIRNVIQNQNDFGTLYDFYIHGYVLLGCMVGLALFVGVIVNNFNEKKGTALLTVDQRRWEDLRKRLRLAQPLHLPLRPDDSTIRSRLYDLTQSSHYRRFIVGLVVLNCGTLAVVPWSDDSAKINPRTLMYISVVITILFVADSILKIIAVTFMGYWRSFRNRFDFILTLTGILWIIVFFAFSSKPASYGYDYVTVWLGVVIILFRFLSLSGKHDTLKMLMMTVSMSLLKSFYIIFVLLLIIMSYAIIGVVLFGTVKYGVAVNNNANFQGSISAMILLFRITTGEDWNKVMHDCMIQEPYCTEAAFGENYWESDCGSVPSALCYFISFYVILTFIFLNLLIAVIIENFSLFISSEEDAALSNNDLYQYQLTWNLVDQNRKGFITVRQARLLLRLLQGRLGVDPSSFLYKHICLEIEKLRGGREVSFHDLLEILAYRSIDDISRSLQLEELLAREELERSIEEEVAIQTIRDWFLNLKKEKVKISRGFSFGASSTSSVESLASSDNEDGQPNRLSVKHLQKRSVSSKSATPTITVNAAKVDENKKKTSNENKDSESGEKWKDRSTLDTWFADQLTC